MKYFLIAILSAFITSLPISANSCFLNDSASQDMKDKWDNTTQTYTNYTCCFYWRLNEDFNWTQQPLMQQNAIFGAVDFDTRIVVYITALKMDNNGSDDYIWEHESEFYKGVEDSYKQFGNARIVEKKRVHIAGKKALKTKATYSLVNDDRLGGESLNFVIISYNVLHQGYGMTFSIMVLEEVEEAFAQYGLTIESMFAGLTFVAPNSLK